MGSVLPKFVDKGFSGRPGTVKPADELQLELVLLGSAEDMCDGAAEKAPKSVQPRVIPMVAVKKKLKARCQSKVNHVRPNALSSVFWASHNDETIVATSIEVLGMLVEGPRRQIFAQYARNLLVELLRNLSDRKSNVLAATCQASNCSSSKRSLSTR
ncbi:hypothetical protein H257_15800 [Aphanomyces astaci]|uniref:Uncharacterized protein n=1 Tax=Aphanomyces astaci TaxID=112090 RepID=W4FMT9_APHAT|nr:hypothetical protein H257_15800 [Aphanomyces astaci]ETV68226.1 hypothetical protein H257_15800 [Aphanomyces astaci]|eukprot:XP_009842311.1 hypothetical protein H257_15800 [Aphanomyces astaci]